MTLAQGFLLIPAVLATAFYAEQGARALRFVVIGVALGGFLRQPWLMLIMGAAAASALTESLQTTVFGYFDFFGLFSVLQGLLALAAGCLLAVASSSKKANIWIYFLTCALLAFSFSISLTLASIHLFGAASPYVSAVLLSACPLLFETLLQSNSGQYDTERYAAGFGVD